MEYFQQKAVDRRHTKYNMVLNNILVGSKNFDLQSCHSRNQSLSTSIIQLHQTQNNIQKPLFNLTASVTLNKTVSRLSAILNDSQSIEKQNDKSLTNIEQQQQQPPCLRDQSSKKRHPRSFQSKSLSLMKDPFCKQNNSPLPAVSSKISKIEGLTPEDILSSKHTLEFSGLINSHPSQPIGEVANKNSTFYQNNANLYGEFEEDIGFEKQLRQLKSIQDIPFQKQDISKESKACKNELLHRICILDKTLLSQKNDNSSKINTSLQSLLLPKHCYSSIYLSSPNINFLVKKHSEKGISHKETSFFHNPIQYKTLYIDKSCKSSSGRPKQSLKQTHQISSVESEIRKIHLQKGKLMKKNNFDQRQVYESHIFDEKHNKDRLSVHLRSLDQRSNKVNILTEDMKNHTQYKSSGYQEDQCSKNCLAQTQKINSYKQYYNQVCSCLTEFNNSLEEKEQTFNFKAYYNQMKKIQVQQAKQSSMKTALQVRDGQNRSDSVQKPNSNLSQVEQFKIVVIETLLMNITQNFEFFIELKKSRKKVVKSLDSILGYNEKIKETLVDEETQGLKRKIDFKEGLCVQTWKAIHSKNLKNVETMKHMKVETLTGIEYIPIEEAWKVYQEFQYFNENLYRYIQIKLQMSQRQKKVGLRRHIDQIKDLQVKQFNKPFVSNKELNELHKIETNLGALFDQGLNLKRQQIVKRMEEYESTKGRFPFVGQLVRLKAQQIDTAQEIFKEKYDSTQQ